MTRILLIHDHAESRDRALDLFSNKEDISVVAADGLESAQQHLHDAETPFDTLLIRWSQSDHQAQKLLCTVQPSRGTRLMAFDPKWRPMDLRQAFHLGVEAFFTEPLEPNAILTELRVIERLGRGLTRARLLMQESVELLKPRRGLWAAVKDPIWARRMASRAAEILSQIEEEHEARISRVRADLERTLLDGSNLDLSLVMAVCDALRVEGNDHMTTAEEHGVELATLDSMVEALEADISDDVEQEVHRPELMWAVEGLATELSVQSESTALLDALDRLRSQGQRFLKSPDQAEAQQGFVQALTEVLQCPLSELSALTTSQLQALAQQATCDDMEWGLHRIRATLLGYCLRDIPTTPYFTLEPERVKALAAVFGAQPHRLKDEVEGIKAVLAAVDPEIPEPLPDLHVLKQVGRNLKKSDRQKGVAFTRLKAAIEAMVEAGAPGGELDRRRVQGLSDLLKVIFESRVGQQALLAAHQALEAEAPSPAAEGVAKYLHAPDLETLRGQLEQWARMPQSQRPRLIEMSGGAQSAAPAPQPAPQPAPPPQPAPQAAPAPQPAPPAKPPAPRRAPASASSELAAFLEAHANDFSGILAHLRALKAQGDEATARQLRKMLGLRPGTSTSQDVRRLMGEARLDGAYVAAQELSDEQAKTSPILNEVALSLRVFGHLSEGAELFERATKLQPNRPSLLFNFARVKIEMGQLEEAATLLERVIELSPDLKAARALLTDLQRRLGASTSASS